MKAGEVEQKVPRFSIFAAKNAEDVSTNRDSARSAESEKERKHRSVVCPVGCNFLELTPPTATPPTAFLVEESMWRRPEIQAIKVNQGESR